MLGRIYTHEAHRGEANWKGEGETSGCHLERVLKAKFVSSRKVYKLDTDDQRLWIVKITEVSTVSQPDLLPGQMSPMLT